MVGMANQTASSSRGWVVTLAGLCINLALGVLYTWSIFTAKFTTVLKLGADGMPMPASAAASSNIVLATGAKTADRAPMAIRASPS